MFFFSFVHAGFGKSLVVISKVSQYDVTFLYFILGDVTWLSVHMNHVNIFSSLNELRLCLRDMDKLG